MLISLGLKESNLATLTNGEIGDILKNATKVDSKIYQKMLGVSFEEYNEARAEVKKEKENVLIENGFSSEQSTNILKNGLYATVEKNGFNSIDLQIDLDELTNLPSRASNCHYVWDVSKVNDILDEDLVYPNYYDRIYFNNYTFSQVIGTGYTYEVTSGTKYYDKIEYFRNVITAADLISKGLYHIYSTSAVDLDYNVFGEVTGSYHHEGYDINLGDNQSLYAPNDAGSTVYITSTGITGGITYTSLYCPTYNISFCLEHLDRHASTITWMNDSTNVKNIKIGEEDNIGAPGVHTHVQVQLGQETGVPNLNSDSTLQSKDPILYCIFY